MQSPHPSHIHSHTRPSKTHPTRQSNETLRDSPALRAALIGASSRTPSFTMKGKLRLGKVTGVLREDSLTAAMSCDGAIHQFLIKLKGVGCYPDTPEFYPKRQHALQTIYSWVYNAFATFKIYYHTSNNELVCSVRLENGTDLAKQILTMGLAPAFSHTADVMYHPPHYYHPSHPTIHSSHHPTHSTHPHTEQTLPAKTEDYPKGEGGEQRSE